MSLYLQLYIILIIGQIIFKNLNYGNKNYGNKRVIRN